MRAAPCHSALEPVCAGRAVTLFYLRAPETPVYRNEAPEVEGAS